MAPAKRRESRPSIEPKRVSLEWVKTFVILAELRCYTKTGEQIGRDQGTVSKHMTQLQSWLRRNLIASKQPATLTEDGTKFLQVAREIFEKLESCRAPLPPPESSPPISGKDIDMSFWTDRNKPK